MKNLFLSLCLKMNAATTGAQKRITSEISHIKNDERGMELIQMILIIVIVVVIGAVVWAFLGGEDGFIQGLIDQINPATPEPWDP